MTRLSPPQQRLLDALQRGAICHYMPYGGRFNPTAYYFCTEDMRRCTSQVRSLLRLGLAEMFDIQKYGDHKIRIVSKTKEHCE